MGGAFDGRLSLHSWTLDSTPLPEMLRAAGRSRFREKPLSCIALRPEETGLPGC